MSSGCSEVPGVKSVKIQNIAQKTEVGKNSKLKKNFCYVCNVQCTGNKNAEDHERGRKHLKKLAEITPNRATSKVNENCAKINKKNKAIALKSKKHKSKLWKFKNKITDNQKTTTESNDQQCEKSDAQSNNQKSKEMHAQETVNHQSYPTSKKNNWQNSNCKNFFQSHQYPNHTRFNNNVRHPNYYPHSNFQQDYCNQNFSGWNPYVNSFVSNGFRFQRFGLIQNPRTGLLPNPNYFIQPWQESGAGCVSFNFNTASNYIPNAEENNVNPPTDQTSNKEGTKSELNFASCPKSNCLTTEDDHEDSGTTSLTHAFINKTIDHSDGKDEASVANAIDSCDLEQPSTQTSNFSNNVKKRDSEKKRVRSKSVSYVESDFSSEKKARFENQNQSFDSDNEQQKIKEYTNTLLETQHGQISRLINPSNYKDKAAVSQLITNLSKSKRKETLTKLKLQPNSSESGRNDDDDNVSVDIHSSVESVQMPDVTTNHSEEILRPNNCANEENVKRSLDKKDKRNTRSLDSEPNSEQQSFTKTNRSDLIPNKKFEDTSNKRSLPDIQQDGLKQTKKRKNLNASNFKKYKDQQSSQIEDFEAFEFKPEPTQIDLIVLQNLADTTETTKVSCAIDSTSDVHKKKRVGALDGNQTDSSVTNSENKESQANFNSEFSVETLIDLFASGSVKVKNEFNDPVIDALKTVDPNELIKACKNSSVASNETANKMCSASPSKDAETKSISQETSSLNEESKESRHCISPVVLGCVINDNVVPAPMQSSSTTVNAPSVLSETHCNNSGNQSPASMSDASKSTDNSFSYVEDCLLPKDKSTFSPYLKELIKDLQKISCQEETVKHQVHEAKGKINEYNSLLEEWKLKKKRLQKEEDSLRMKRNEIIKLMQNAVKTNETNNEKPTETTSPCPEKLIPETVLNECNLQSKVSELNSADTSSDSDSDKSCDLPVLTKKSKQNISQVGDEIEIIPVQKEAKHPELIVIDDSPEKDDDAINTREEILTNVTSSDPTPTVFDMKILTAHSTVINCLVVFEGYIYTSSNDSTARRFSIKDPNNTVTYLHTARNVTEVVVETVQNDALVFTSCSNKVISLFIASNGTKIKTFFQSCPIMSICKGWGKFYAGMSNGVINVYNWKYEEKEIVKTEYCASRIATAHQGRLRVLIVLASNGNISLRDAETGLLIRYIKGFVKFPSWLSVNNDLVYLSSSDKTLCIMDIMTGRVEKKIYLSSHITGLAVFEDSIFTISYSGIINCYNKEKVSDKRLYYGAGKNGLTCVHVYKDWVFTGNRRGEVSVFEFDPSSRFLCEFGNCCCEFGLKGDLKFHLEKDHLSKKKTTRCMWSMCGYIFPKNWNSKDKWKHVFNHTK